MLSEMAEYFHVYHGFPSVRVGSGCQSDDHASSRTGLLKQWDYRLQMAQVCLWYYWHTVLAEM